MSDPLESGVYADGDVADEAVGRVRAYQARVAGTELSDGEVSDLVAAAQHRFSVRRAWHHGMAAAAAAAAVAIGIFFVAAPERVESQGPQVAESVASELAAQPGVRVSSGVTARTVKFDGGEMVLASGSSLSVESIRPEGATVRLGHGKMTASITPAAKLGGPGEARGEGRQVTSRPRDWHVLAGGFDVRVVGTVFTVDWAPEGRRVTIGVERGVVEVTGPGLPAAKRVTAGQTFVATEPGDAVVGDESQPAVDVAKERRAKEGETKAAKEQQAGRPSARDWKALATAGDYQASMVSAEAVGVERLARELPVAELVRLADVARMAGRTNAAVKLLVQVRTRAPGSSQAASAAYALATTAFDQQGDLAKAARWFDVYLRESSGSALAREALGRKLEAEVRLGRKASAQRSAKRYLHAYPEGPHSGFARRVLRDGR